MLNTIKETLDYIYSFVNLESNLTKKYLDKEYSLDNIVNILHYFNNPQNDKKIIHIAGTKGKGSTTLMISKLLIDMGYSVATFVSPHLIRTNERILSNLDEISDEELIRITNFIKDVVEKNNLKPTTFELFFLIFLIYGSEKRCDYFVIEVGLGGRLDCTNIVNPIISVITSIGFDHLNILGNSIKKIAFEKAGIIKENSNVVVGKQYYNCSKIFKQKSVEMGARYFNITNLFKVSKIKASEKGICFSFSFRKTGINLKDFFIPLYGVHQVYNFLTALYTVYLIDKNVMNLITGKKRFDIELNGRVRLADSKIPLIVDVSHNKESAIQLVKTLKSHFPGKRWNILLGLSQDKDVKSYIKSVSKISKKIIVTSLSLFKKSNPCEIYELAKRYNKETFLIQSQDEAFDKIMEEKNNILITGSFYLAGPCLEMLNKRNIN